MATGVAPGGAHRPLGRRGPAGLAFLVSVVLVLAPAPARAAEPSRVPGIDVSKWQGDVDWAAVASTNVRYVIMRATIGDTGGTPLSVDPRYGEYLAGATANGLVVGAYHRAHVGTADGDPEEEADFFVDLAQIEAGDVVPVLDIEETHGLSVAEMKDWVRTWVMSVYARTGVRPMLYSSPYFWRTNMGDATWFATHGYPLWIAHWGVDEPDVPADGWGAHGWTYWQWTSTGTVDGIGTAVDRDRFRGPDLVHGTIASLAVTPAAGGTVTGARIRCGGDGTKCVRLANPDTVLTLTATPDPGAVLLGWTGACGDAGTSPTCDVAALGDVAAWAVFGFPVQVQLAGTGGGTVTSSPAGIDCGSDCAGTFAAGSTVTLEAAPDSASAFDGWSGACAGTVPTCTVTVSTVTDVTATFDSVVSVEEDGAGTRYSWGRAVDSRAIGGSYRWERRAGASVTFGFSGGAVTLFTMSGPAMGKGRVQIDGDVVATFDGYEPAVTGSKLRFDGLAASEHELSVTVLGTKRSAAAGTRVAVDALRWGGTLRRDPKGTTRWASVEDPAASGGAAAISDVPGARARLRFDGTGVSVRVLRGQAMGKAELWVDGTLVRTVDLYAATSGFATIDVASGLADGSHVVTLVVLGAHRPASAGSGVGVDRWNIR
jgi:GH25 family lysozyme M1 (1,4-beta-N-acetylmuramidase)